MSFQCPGCAADVNAPGHMCHPAPNPLPCAGCGEPSLANHLCEKKIREVEFFCIRCGRLSLESNSLCAPIKIF